MSNPLTTPYAVNLAQPLNELLNVAHERPFSLLFANYSWLLAIAGGITLIWAVYAWHGRRDWSSFRLAMPLVVIMVIAGFLNVLAEVQQPSRLFYGYLYGWTYWDTAIIKYGIILLPLLLLGAWWLSFQALDAAALDRVIGRLPRRLRPLADIFSLWSRRFRLTDHPRLEKTVLVVVFLLGLFAPLYSSIFLMNEHGVPVWNSPALPLIFLATGVAIGAATLMLLGPLLHRLATGERVAVDASLIPIALVSVTLAMIVWAGWTWWLGRFGTIAELRAANLFMGPYATAVFWHWWFAGLLLPLGILLSPLRRHASFCYLAAAGILWGGYAVRVLILTGGQALNRSGTSYLAFQPDHHALWYTGFNVLFLAGLLTLLALMISVAHSDNSSRLPDGGAQHG